MDYFHAVDFVELEFNRNKELKISRTYVKTWLSAVGDDIWTWEFDERKNTYLIYRSGKLFFVLKPISEAVVKIKSRFSRQKQPLLTKELTLIRVNKFGKKTGR